MWILFALMAAIFAAMVAVFGKIGLTNIDSTVATMVRAAVMFVFLALAVAAMKKLPEISAIHGRALFFIVLSGIAGALSWLFYFLALKLGPAARVASLDRLSIVFVVIFAAIFLAEKITWKIGIGALLMAIGAVFIAL